MFIRLFMPGVLLSLCVVVHALVITALLSRLTRIRRRTVVRFWRATWELIRIALWILAAHLLEIGIWAGFLTHQQMFADFTTAFYFSAVTYTTVGYGDVVLPGTWRLFAAVEGLTGILMCGWSTGVFFAVVSAMYSSQRAEPKADEGIQR